MQKNSLKSSLIVFLLSFGLLTSNIVVAGDGPDGQPAGNNGAQGGADQGGKPADTNGGKPAPDQGAQGAGNNGAGNQGNNGGNQGGQPAPAQDPTGNAKKSKRLFKNPWVICGATTALALGAAALYYSYTQQDNTAK